MTAHDPEGNGQIERLQAEVARLTAEQAATASILRAIATSPRDRQSVLQSICEEAVRLCEADQIPESG